MVAGDGDTVELRHLLRGIFEDVGDNLHRECWRVDIGVTHHELLKNIVLDGTCHLFELSALLQTGIDVECQDRQYGTVHGHGDRHLVQGNSVEQHLHVLQRTDTYTCLTYITYYTLVVGVVTTMGGKVECNGKTLLTRSQVTAVEGITLLSGRETCILTDGPGTEGIHHTIGATQEGWNTGCEIEVFHPFKVFFGINGLNVNLLGSSPVGSNTSLFLPFFTILGVNAGKDIYIAK